MLKKWKSTMLSFAMIATLGLTTSCGDNSAKNIDIAGLNGPHVALLQDNLLIKTVFENIELEGGLKYNIPKFKYSYLEISPDVESNGTMMTVSISLKDILGGKLDDLSMQKLPGGRNIPGVASGSLPAISFSVEKFHNMTLYISKDVFGIFLPTTVGVDGAIASFRYYISEQKAGTISLVGNDENGENSGVLLLLNMDQKVKKQMNKVYKKFN